MRKQTFRNVIWVGLGLLFSYPVWAQKLVVPDDMQKILAEEVTKSVVVHPLDLEAARRIDEAFEGWVGSRMDLQAAQVRESARIPGRLSFRVQAPATLPARTSPQSAGDEAVRPLEEVVNQFFYTRSLNRYAFRKTTDVPAQRRLENDQAVLFATGVLQQQRFVEENGAESFGSVVVRELRRDSPDGSGGGTELTLLQSVKFHRNFLGSPVVNSAITVDFHPDSMEIVGLKHYDWTPAAPAINQSVLLPTSLDAVLAQLASEVPQHAAPGDTVTLRQVMRGWYQGEMELIPVLICHLEFAHGDHSDGYTQTISLIAGDEIGKNMERAPSRVGDRRLRRLRR